MTDVDELRAFMAECDEAAAAAHRAHKQAKWAAVAAYRDEHGLSLAELAEHLGVSKAQAQQWVEKAS